MPLLSYYDVTAQRKDPAGDNRVLLVLFVVNATFAATTLFWWTFMSLFVAAPIQWATWRGVGARPDLFDYPFIVLWLLPAAGVACGWIARRAGYGRIACWLAFFPVVLLGLVFGWFYLTPTEWR